MPDRKTLSPLDLAGTPDGFSIVDVPALQRVAETLVLSHLQAVAQRRFPTLTVATDFLSGEGYPAFREKSARMLPAEDFGRLHRTLLEEGFLDPAAGEFVTGEEGRGDPDVYWRLVRPDSPSDVGSIHADYWFWDLLGFDFPSGMQRVKIWLPLLQDDDNPSLMVLPGSHLRDFRYTSFVNHLGHRKPQYADEDITDRMIPAPVRTGQAVIFNDRLLHGGRSTGVLRISLEFTLACRPRD
ncbi:MAG: phytanoyl-CoA dioxygenase family protein [Phenylobacterium sp.]|jgi:hypothetical protein|nr:phytanoyl-CoA dioxygenase family protein [Phenylobacterium sp.]